MPSRHLIALVVLVVDDVEVKVAVAANGGLYVMQLVVTKTVKISKTFNVAKKYKLTKDYFSTKAPLS